MKTFNKDKLGDFDALIVISHVQNSDEENRLKADRHANVSLLQNPTYFDSPWGKLYTAWKQRTDPDSYWREGRELVEEFKKLSDGRSSKRDLAHTIENIEVNFLVTDCKEELAKQLPFESGNPAKLNDKEFDFFDRVLKFRRSLFGMLKLSEDKNRIYHLVFDAWTFDGESPLFWITRAHLEIERIWGNENEVKTKKLIPDGVDLRKLSRFSNSWNGNKQDMNKFRRLLIQLIRDASAKQEEKPFFDGINPIMSNGKNNCPIGLKILLGSTDEEFKEIVSNPESFDCDSSSRKGGKGFQRTLADLAIQVKNMKLCIKASKDHGLWKIEIKSGVSNSNDSEHFVG